MTHGIETPFVHVSIPRFFSLPFRSFYFGKVSVFFVVKAELNANFVSEGVSSFFSLWQSVGFFRYESQNLTPFLFLNKVLLPFHFGKVLDFFAYWYLLRSFYWQFGFFVVEALAKL
ncbi:uncharacterized protein OCT59_007605 [Rhizophagus irregularis]|uniref:uncharacterized protein n=1 Tax=Rhizophagus irregularis TaxID=588596 RepID=UPI0033286209|nr:hypothetical protein OCT59_007605 [Rhizophagus irregularis]